MKTHKVHKLDLKPEDKNNFTDTIYQKMEGKRTFEEILQESKPKFSRALYVRRKKSNIPGQEKSYIYLYILCIHNKR